MKTNTERIAEAQGEDPKRYDYLEVIEQCLEDITSDYQWCGKVQKKIIEGVKEKENN